MLLKGLTWPGVINSWFLGTVRSEPFASLSLPRSPSIERAIPRGLSRRARNVTMNRDNRYFRLALQPGGVVRRREGRRWSDTNRYPIPPRTNEPPNASRSSPEPVVSEPVPHASKHHNSRVLTHNAITDGDGGVRMGGYVLVCLYFVFGSAVTKIKLEQKQAEGIAEARAVAEASAASGAAASRGSRARASPSPASAPAKTCGGWASSPASAAS